MPVVEISVTTPNGTGTVLRVDNERVRSLDYQSDSETVTVWLDDGIGGMTINNIKPDGAAQIAQRLCGVEVRPGSLNFRVQRVLIYAVEYPDAPAVISDDVALSD